MLKTSATPKTYTSDSYNNSGEVGALTRQLERLQASFEKIDSDVDKIKEDNIQFKNSMITALSDAATAKTAAYTATDGIEDVVKSQTEINQKIAEIDDSIQWATNTKEKIQEALQVITKAKTDLINQISDFQYEIQTAVVDGVDEIAVQGVTDELTNRVRNQIEKELDFTWVNDRLNELEKTLKDLSGMDWKQLGDVYKKLDDTNKKLDEAFKQINDIYERVSKLEKSINGSSSVDLSANNCAILTAQYNFVYQLAGKYGDDNVAANLSKFHSSMESECKDSKVDTSRYQYYWGQIQEQFMNLLNVSGKLIIQGGEKMPDEGKYEKAL